MVANTIKIFQKLTMEITILECKKLIKPKVDFFFLMITDCCLKLKKTINFHLTLVFQLR